MYRKCYRYQDAPIASYNNTIVHSPLSKNEEVIVVPYEARSNEKHSEKPPQVAREQSKIIPKNDNFQNEVIKSPIKIPFNLKGLIKDGKILDLIYIDDLIIILILLLLVEEESDDTGLMLALMFILCT